MSYLDEVPKYVYELPCGHECHSQTPSVADDEDGQHWFCCRRHDEPVWMGVEPSALVELPPRHAAGMRMSDNQLCVRHDAATEKERVREYYRAHWNAVSVRDVVRALKVSQRHVEAVSADLGVYDHEEQHAAD